MRWHLKDRELEEKLNKTSHPMHTFTDELNKKMARIPKEQLPRVLGVEVTFQRIGTGGVILENNVLKFSIEELENIPEYDPHGWNEYPAVTPPEGVLMRVEFIFDGILRRNCSTFEKGAWRITKSGDPSYDITLDNVKRFRPWED